MKLKPILLLVVIVPVLIILALIGKNYAVNTYRDWKYAPTINPQPKYFMTVKVNIDPVLKKNLKIDLNVVYETSNPVCKIWPNGQVNEGGVKSNRVEIKNSTIDNDGQTYKFALDYYLSGRCKWQVSYFYYQFYYNNLLRTADANTSVGFSNESNNSANNSIKQYWLCSANRCSVTNESALSFPSSLSSGSNYIFNLIFERDKK
jgi:hypothetical protein